MSYQQALEAAGATVLEYESFGSYQGDWWAKVVFEGKTGWVKGSYGSCSGCDAFEGEFGYSDSHDHADHKYIDSPSSAGFDPEKCEACAALKEKLRAFGAGYLDGLWTQEEAEKNAAENLSWDSDAPAMLAWIKAHPLESVN